MTTVCIIPARGGSRRIPQKNIRSFQGRPMIAWTIEAARGAGCFDRVVVSTEDEDVATIATAEGAEVPFRRPATLADDFTGTNPVVAHAVSELRATTPDIREVCCVYATAPFVSPTDLRRGRDALRSSGAEFAVSVTTFPFPVQRAITVDGVGFVRPMFPDAIRARSQDLQEAYHDAGQFYWGCPEAFIEHDSVFAGARTVAVRVPRSRVQDIDTMEDWERAEMMFASLQADR